jgi:hypothetical protein
MRRQKSDEEFPLAKELIDDDCYKIHRLIIAPTADQPPDHPGTLLLAKMSRNKGIRCVRCYLQVSENPTRTRTLGRFEEMLTAAGEHEAAARVRRIRS